MSERSRKNHTITEALTAIRKKDTMDIYARRLRGTSALTTRAGTIIGLPSVAMGLLSESNTFGPQTLAVGGTATVLTGAAISGAVYGVQRVTEPRRAQARQEQQRIVQEKVDGEPIDIIRNKRSINPRKKTPLTLRWYGADTAYQTTNESYPVDRFKKIVAFADENNFQDVVVSAQILTLGDEEALHKTYENNMTSTEEFFKKAKGIRITDTKADAELVRLTVEQANKLIEELKATNDISRIEALAEWIIDNNENHPIITAYSTWKDLGKRKELKKGMVKIIETGLQRHFSGEIVAEPILVQFTSEEKTTEETDQDDTKEKELEVYSVRFPVDTTVMVTPHGLQITKIPRGLAGDEYIKIDRASFPQIVGTDMETFVTTLLEKRGEKVQPHERWEIELALYYLLNKQSDEKTVLAKTTNGKEQSVEPENNTFYERMIEERPRTNILWPLPRKRGKVTKEKQTIQYRPAFWRNAGKKLSAAALAGALGAGAGIGWGYAWQESDTWKDVCNNKKLPQDMQTYCASSEMEIFNLVGPKGQPIYNANAKLEEYTILKAYQAGIISQKNIETFASTVNEQWLTEKQNDLSRRFNLYGGDNSYIGDVETGGENPAVWSLMPINGASTEGYWTQNTQSHITIENYTLTSLPPFSNKSIKFDNPYLLQLLAPLGTTLTKEQQGRVEFFRKLDIPTSPREIDNQRIGINGRQLTGTGELFALGVEMSRDQTIWETYSLPVLQGADIVAGHITVKDLATDEILAEPKGRFIQRNDGTFALLLPQDLPTGYLDINYWIDPQAKSDLPVRAERPMTAQTRGKHPKLLTEILNETDIAKLNQELGLSPDASAEQTADAIAQSRKYSFTPYKDAEELYDQNDKFETNDMLRIAAEFAENLNSADCNVASFIEMTATRGKDGDKFLNGIDGFRNNQDNVLSKLESHLWTINSEGEMIDPTPSQPDESETPPVEAFTETQTSHKDLPKEIAEYMTLAALLAGAAYTGRRFGPRVVEAQRQHTFESRRRFFDGPQPELDHDIARLKHLLYAPATSAFDEAAISDNTTDLTRDERLRSIPTTLTPEMVDEIIRDKDVTISPELHERIRTMVASAIKARS